MAAMAYPTERTSKVCSHFADGPTPGKAGVCAGSSLLTGSAQVKPVSEFLQTHGLVAFRTVGPTVGRTYAGWQPPALAGSEARADNCFAIAGRRSIAREGPDG